MEFTQGSPVSHQNSQLNKLCRVCLTESKIMFPILNKLEIDNENLEITVILEKVVGSKVVQNNIYPLQICSVCTSSLEISYKFIKQYEDSQMLLSFNENKDTTKEDIVPSAPVEIIVGDNKYDLNDIIVIEEDSEDNSNFDGFLNNLGKEISAKFVKKKSILNNKMLDRNVDVNNEENVSFTCVEIINEEQLEIDVYSNQDVVNETYVFKKVPPLKSHEITETDIKPDLKELSALLEKRKLFTKVNSTKLEIYQYPCSICGKIYSSEKKLKRHESIIHRADNRKFTCEVCSYNTKSYSGYRHHKLSHFDKQFMCEICSKPFLTKASLKIHMESHKNHRSHLCNVCGKGFNYANALTYHLRTHSGEKKYNCKHCGAKFTMPCGLKRHLRTHTGDKPYICKFCSRAFSSKGEVDTHEMTHTGYRPYSCKYCQKGFTKTHNLKRHLLSHEGPHKCEICKKSFIEINILSMHYQISHKEKTNV